MFGEAADDGLLAMLTRVDLLPEPRYLALLGALGKMMLAHLPWSAVEEILAAHPPLEATPSTLVDPDALRRELRRVAQQG